METPFSSAMSQKSDDDLYRILNEWRSEFKLEAIEAAETEFKKRNLDKTGNLPQKKEIESIHPEYHDKTINKLETHWKIVAFLTPYINVYLFSSILEDEGYDNIANELKIWSIYGFIFYAFIVILLFLLF